MRPNQIKLSSQTFSDWQPVNFHGSEFGAGIGCNVSEGAVLTYSIEFTFDNPYTKLPVSISRTTTTATATFKEEHGKAVGDTITVGGHREDNLKGTFEITAATATTVDFTVADTGSASENGYAVVCTVFVHPDISGVSDNQEAAFDKPPTAYRLNCTSYTSGLVTANITFADLP